VISDVGALHLRRRWSCIGVRYPRYRLYNMSSPSTLLLHPPRIGLTQSFFGFYAWELILDQVGDQSGENSFAKAGLRR